MSQEYDYSAYQTRPTDEVYRELEEAAMELDTAEMELKRLNEQVKLAEARVTRWREQVLPELMRRAGSSEWRSLNGNLQIKLEKTYHASIPVEDEEKRAKALAWFETNGLGRIVKRKFVIEFGKDDEAWAKKFERDMAQRKRPLQVEKTMDVHPSTLKKFVKETLEAGGDLPMDLLQVHVRNVAKVKR